MDFRRYFCQTDLAQSTNPKGTGTDHLMVALVDRILKRLDQNLNTPSVITTMLDWSAAFDRQCQTIGIKKFLEMGVRPSIVRVLTCYLSNRSISVKFNGNTSYAWSASYAWRWTLRYTAWCTGLPRTVQQQCWLCGWNPQV